MARRPVAAGRGASYTRRTRSTRGCDGPTYPPPNFTPGRAGPRRLPVMATAALAPVMLAWLWPGCMGSSTTATTPTATAALPAGPPDADGDGYSEVEDCDDADATVNPGAREVTCDGNDNDCLDGDLRTDCVLSRDEAQFVALDDSPYFSGLEADLDGRPGDDLVVSASAEALGWVVSGLGTDDVRFAAVNGRPARTAGDVDGDGQADLWVTDRSSMNYKLLLGPITSDRYPDTDAAALLTGADGSFGWNARGDVDLDGDGFVDLMDPAGVVCPGPFAGEKSQYDVCSFYGHDLRGQGGVNPMASVGDVTGDGLPEIGVMYYGEVRVIAGDPRAWGPTGDDVVQHLVGDAGMGVTGVTSVAFVGDLTGDGYDDLAVSLATASSDPNALEDDYDALTLVAGPLRGGGATTVVQGLGYATVTPVREVSLLGDVDGDGADELTVTDSDNTPGILRVPTAGAWAYEDVVVAGQVDGTWWRPSNSARTGADANADGLVDFTAFDMTEGRVGVLAFTALAEVR